MEEILKILNEQEIIVIKPIILIGYTLPKDKPPKMLGGITGTLKTETFSK